LRACRAGGRRITGHCSGSARRGRLIADTSVSEFIAAAEPAAVRVRSSDQVALAGAQLAQIAAGVLGVLLITSEYATGLIRASFAAVPRRLPILWGQGAAAGRGHGRGVRAGHAGNVPGRPVDPGPVAPGDLTQPARRGPARRSITRRTLSAAPRVADSGIPSRGRVHPHRGPASGMEARGTRSWTCHSRRPASPRGGLGGRSLE